MVVSYGNGYISLIALCMYVQTTIANTVKLDNILVITTEVSITKFICLSFFEVSIYIQE